MPYRKFDFFQDILVLASTVRYPSYSIDACYLQAFQANVAKSRVSRFTSLSGMDYHSSMAQIKNRSIAKLQRQQYYEGWIQSPPTKIYASRMADPGGLERKISP